MDCLNMKDLNSFAISRYRLSSYNGERRFEFTGQITINGRLTGHGEEISFLGSQLNLHPQHIARHHLSPEFSILDTGEHNEGSIGRLHFVLHHHDAAALSHRLHLKYSRHDGG